MRFPYSISLVPGKELITAYTLSRAPVSEEDVELESDVTTYVSLIMNSLPATEKRLAEIRTKQDQYEVCVHIKQYCDSGWPQSMFTPGAVKPYLPVASQLIVVDGLLM